MHAAIVLGELIKNKYSMASRWDLANGYDNGNDHGMFNNGDEPGVPKWNPRPAYFYMYYFQQFFGDHLVSSTVSGSANILAYASRFHSGEAGIVVINKGTTEQCIKLVPSNYGFGEWYYVYSLQGGTDNGEFSQVVYVNDTGPTNATGGPITGLEEIAAWSYTTTGDIKFISPPRSVQYILLESGEHTAVPDDKNQVTVNQFILYQNHPNPFNPRTVISYILPEVTVVTLKVYDIAGREIVTLANKEKTAAGFHTISFDGSKLPSGIYFYKLQTSNTVLTRKMMLIK
jgi:hypothetical protein